MEWISCKDRLPDNPKHVLCACERGPMFVGQYTKGHELEFEDDYYQGEYDEVEDRDGMLYLKPGWYESEEQRDGEHDCNWMSRLVTHWMPLPEPPKIV